MTTQQNPIITPASSSDEKRREAGNGAQRDLSGVYANPAPTEQNIDGDAELVTQEWEQGSQRRSASSDLGTPHLSDQTSSQMNERWQQIQAQFVDDPRKSVGEAHDLVGELVQKIVDGFAKERSTLERQWSEGDNVSTEDLRLCLQNYREFFGRLLPTAMK